MEYPNRRKEGRKEGRRKETVNKAGDVVQLGERFPAMHKSLSLIPNAALTRSSGTGL